MNGSELAARLRAYNHDLKVIYSTGYGPEIAMNDLRVRDDAFYLAKPYGPDKLVAVVRECLDAPPTLS
jgi:CheY-like chemotaxis protein